jgi:hypothetical protein
LLTLMFLTAAEHYSKARLVQVGFVKGECLCLAKVRATTN